MASNSIHIGITFALVSLNCTWLDVITKTNFAMKPKVFILAMKRTFMINIDCLKTIWTLGQRMHTCGKRPKHEQLHTIKLFTLLKRK